MKYLIQHVQFGLDDSSFTCSTYDKSPTSRWRTQVFNHLVYETTRFQDKDLRILYRSTGLFIYKTKVYIHFFFYSKS